MTSFLKKLLPIEYTSIASATKRATAEFGYWNLIKIAYFISLRFIKYKMTLAKLPDNELIESNVIDFKMLLRKKGGGISWDLLVNGIREENATHFFRNEIKPGMNVLEVGANIGYYLIQESIKAGDSGHIYAFEPDPSNIELLQKNIELNKLKNITLKKSALGNNEGRMDFYISDRGNLSGFTRPAENTVKVDVFKADSLLADQKIDYIRMDAEGYEFEILKGSERILKESASGIFVEIHPFYLLELGTSMRALIEWLENINFHIVKAYSDYDWNPKEFSNARDLLSYKYAEKMVWRTFFRKQ